MPDDKIPNPVRPAFGSERDGEVVVNIGPSHPASHGTIPVIAALDGVSVDVHCGYLHRGFEKECESPPGATVFVDRLATARG
jgi:NADH-quinone oxidoreductase subunit D